MTDRVPMTATDEDDRTRYVAQWGATEVVVVAEPGLDLGVTAEETDEQVTLWVVNADGSKYLEPLNPSDPGSMMVSRAWAVTKAPA